MMKCGFGICTLSSNSNKHTIKSINSLGFHQRKINNAAAATGGIVASEAAPGSLEVAATTIATNVAAATLAEMAVIHITSGQLHHLEVLEAPSFPA